MQWRVCQFLTILRGTDRKFMATSPRGSMKRKRRRRRRVVEKQSTQV